MADIISEINNKHSESQQEMKNALNDEFISGRALAYQEIYEMIQTRAKVYGIKISED